MSIPPPATPALFDSRRFDFSLILGEKKRRKDFRLFFSIFLRSRTVLGNLTGKKFISFSIDLLAKV